MPISSNRMPPARLIHRVGASSNASHAHKSTATLNAAQVTRAAGRRPIALPGLLPGHTLPGRVWIAAPWRRLHAELAQVMVNVRAERRRQSLLVALTRAPVAPVDMRVVLLRLLHGVLAVVERAQVRAVLRVGEPEATFLVHLVVAVFVRLVVNVVLVGHRALALAEVGFVAPEGGARSWLDGRGLTTSRPTLAHPPRKRS
jgi:hypothetical protein